VQRVVVVGLRGVVHDDVVGGHEFIDQGLVADVPLDELETVGRKMLERLQVARVRHLVEDGHEVVRGGHHVVDKIGADEAGAAGY
jgi:hypothetical protein